VPGPYFLDRLQADVRASFVRALEQLRAAGVLVDTATVPHAADAPAIYLPICLGEAAALHAATLDALPDAYTPAVRQRLELGRYIPAEDYVRARAGQDVLRRDIDRAIGDRDALVLPTMAIVAPPLGAATVPMETGEEPVRPAMLRLTQPFNLSGHPAITLPIAPSSEGLPIGLQLVGRHTGRLLDLAALVERVVAVR
jgi:aspartyl-tRNA(Asn)/glutamyl-tRNA(Gln) amidotransferase subunit A